MKFLKSFLLRAEAEEIPAAPEPPPQRLPNELVFEVVDLALSSFPTQRQRDELVCTLCAVSRAFRAEYGRMRPVRRFQPTDAAELKLPTTWGGGDPAFSKAVEAVHISNWSAQTYKPKLLKRVM
ncbi:hypothetical protein JCM10213v2_003456 [Rhodosporidiobolus nylandii]